MPTLHASLTFIAAFLLNLWCGAAQAQTRQARQTQAFTALNVSGAVNVFVKQGRETSVEVVAPEQVLPHIVTEVAGGTLKIYRDKSFNWKSLVNQKENQVKVYITCPTLSGVTASGASDVKGESAFVLDDFRIQASGASDITLQVRAKTLTVQASGASDVKLSGEAERQQVNSSGSSDYRAFELRSRAAVVNVSGASDAQVFADEELSASASGASDIRYKGAARLVSNRTSGGSGVKQVR